jgi:hypothetical protein
MSDPPAHRFYLDEDMPPSAAKIGRALGLDVVAAVEVAPLPRADPEHLASAAADRRAVVTYNRNDFLNYSRAFLAAGKAHAGVLVVVPTVPRIGQVLAHALQSWCAGRAPLQPYEIQYLSGWRADQ